MSAIKLSVIGLGNMGGAIIGGVVSSSLLHAEEICVFDAVPEKREDYRSRGFSVATDPADCAASSDVVLIAVKPQNMSDLLRSISVSARNKLVISIAAGIKTETIEMSLPESRVIRVMPNTPLLVASGVSAYARGKLATDDDCKTVQSIFASAGTAFELDESAINPITALTSSSVAYFARVIDDMRKWAKTTSLSNMSDDELVKIISAVAIGSAKLLTENNMAPADLIKAVTSPGGTTEQANRIFDERDLTSVFFDAMSACLARAVELSGDKTE